MKLTANSSHSIAQEYLKDEQPSTPKRIQISQEIRFLFLNSL